MALFDECMLKCARKLLDTADIVREAMLRQSPEEQKGLVCRLVVVVGRFSVHTTIRFGSSSLGSILHVHSTLASSGSRCRGRSLSRNEN